MKEIKDKKCANCKNWVKDCNISMLGFRGARQKKGHCSVLPSTIVKTEEDCCEHYT